MRSITLSQEEIHNLTQEVAKRNLEHMPLTSQYEVLRVKDKDFFFVLYNTGKMVFQESKGFDDLLNEILVRERCTVIGTDEAGKGEWYGPLVVAGVALAPEDAIGLRKMGVGDSKGLSSFRIYEIGKVLATSEIKRKAKVLQPHVYNDLYEDYKREKKNLNDLLVWAHTEVILDLLSRVQPSRTKVFIDKFDSSQTPEKFENLKKMHGSITEKPGGESEVAVAAASVLAKFLFEEEVRTLNSEFNLDLRRATPVDIPKDVLPLVAKLHFKNVNQVL